jgi:hypothetical protein
LSLRVHWQNYGYHGCGERSKQKVPRTFQCGIKSEITGKLVSCAVRSITKAAGDDPVPQLRDETTAHRVYNGNRYSAIVTNLVLPPK